MDPTSNQSIAPKISSKIKSANKTLGAAAQETKPDPNAKTVNTNSGASVIRPIDPNILVQSKLTVHQPVQQDGKRVIFASDKEKEKEKEKEKDDIIKFMSDTIKISPEITKNINYINLIENIATLKIELKNK
jgi:hypothetical protein